ncbi:right-handed parallel beta-helix repeat-containing protein [Tamlana agarivorans]|uniref:Right-handed parallel beta-helix repeat-containing protein n=1 Tax=Pseudotamlana agarivorans TaxID=481183 RepID=A0ACC5UA55_9FLAO|nr:right-handed parallel beta-helix repeat-containing protein [Tamlana agarivorans]MBU2951165.1 right-handed parallel beta-helix repeat-containing protein [Tamlana agarivorans]
MKTTYNVMMLTVLLLLVTTSCNNEELFVDTSLEDPEEIIKDEPDGIELNDKEFTFIPEHWGIVQGVVDSQTALNNRNILESIMIKAKSQGFTTFKIDKLDAYFEVGIVTSETSNQNFYASIEAINVPSDFNLIMTDNTHLRVQPNSAPKYCLLALRDVSNVTVTGGNLYGDRDEHDYSSGGSHEWGDVVELHAARNSTIDNVKMMNGSGDGLRIHSLKHAFEADYNPSNNLTVKNCTLDSNRRNNISIVDGFNIYIDSNQILNAGIDTPNSKGANPRFGLDVEAVRKSDGNGGYIYYQKAEDIYITNNTEKGSANGGMTVHIGYNVTIDGNFSERGLSYTYAYGTKIINNTVTAVQGRAEGAGIGGGKNSESNSIYDNIIAGNTITGFDTGINISNRDVKVYDNIIKDFEVGIYPINLIDSEIYNNTMISTQDKSKGIFVFRSNMDNVIIRNNDITAEANSIKLDDCNNSGDAVNYNFLITGNNFKSPSYTKIDGVQGVEFLNNSFNQGIQVYDSKNLVFEGNSVITNSHNGIRFRETNYDITLKGNKIDVAEGRDCVVIDSDTNTNEINQSSNACI